MEKKALYVPPVTESFALDTNHPILEGSPTRGQADGEDATPIEGSW